METINKQYIVDEQNKKIADLPLFLFVKNTFLVDFHPSIG